MEWEEEDARIEYWVRREGDAIPMWWITNGYKPLISLVLGGRAGETWRGEGGWLYEGEGLWCAGWGEEMEWGKVEKKKKSYRVIKDKKGWYDAKVTS